MPNIQILSKIPRIIHLYWGNNKPLSFLRYLTVYSFQKLNPDWDIQVHTAKDPCKGEPWETDEQKDSKFDGTGDWFKELSCTKNVTMNFVDFNSMNMEDIPEVIKSDIYRLHLLHTVGGIWSDFDILYLRPLEYGIVDDHEKEAYFCDQEGYFSIGFMAGAPGNNIFKFLFEKAIKAIDLKQYQGAGSTLYGRYRKTIVESPETGSIAPGLVYPIAWNETEDLFIRDQTAKILDAIGVHWFAGDRVSAITDNAIAPDNIDKFNHSTIGKAVKSLWMK